MPDRARAGWLGRVAVWSLIALSIACTRVSAPADRTELVLDRGRGAVPASYVGLHIHKAGSGAAWPSVPFAGWRLWDAHVSWPWLEPAGGDWHWAELVRLIQLAGEHRIEVLLPLGLSPTWASARPAEASAYGRPGFAAEPADLDDWRRHVETVASRYTGRVHLYEIWNEPNLPSFYSGDIAKLLELCRTAHAIVKRIDPVALVVSPAATGADGVGWLDRFLSAGGASCFDVVGFHFYVWPDAPEAIVPLVARVQDVLGAHGISDRPLWNTETGWHVARPGSKNPRGARSESDAAATVARALVLGRAAGIARFYWYAWDNEDMGLADRAGRASPPALALAEVQRWLVGADLAGCRRAADGAWTCALRRDGRAQRIVWNPAGPAERPSPDGARIARRRDVTGTLRSMRPGVRTIEIGPAPQLLEAAE